MRCPMASNRKAAGFEMWKSGARGHGMWTFQRPFGDPFNDFSGHGKMECPTYPHLLRPNDWSTYQGAIPTIAWEAMREGINDYAYLYTLHSLIHKACQSNHAAVREAAARASEKLNVLPSKVVGVWSGGTTPKRMDEIVREIADEIVALQAAMADHAKREK